MADSEVIIRTAIAALGDERIRVVMTSGYQPVPNGIGALPANFMLAPYLPAIAMAKRSDLMIHHGGHGSFMTGLSAGTPQVIVPTFSERESNARRMAALGVGEFVIPTVCECGEKHLDVDEFRAVVKSVLGDPEYQERATTLTGSMRKYGGAREAADRIERFDASRA
jgi:MGT family glycosyltransferase